METKRVRKRVRRKRNNIYREKQSQGQICGSAHIYACECLCVCVIMRVKERVCVCVKYVLKVKEKRKLGEKAGSSNENRVREGEARREKDV